MQKHKLYFRSVYGNANIKKIKVEFPGWAGDSKNHSDGAIPQPWHCVPFLEASTYGLELIYPFNSEAIIRTVDQKIQVDPSNNKSWEEENIPPSWPRPAFMQFAPGHFGMSSCLEIVPPKDHVIRIEPHPAFFTDNSGTFPCLVTGHLQGDWWPKVFFVVFKSPLPNQEIHFKKNMPYGKIIFVPKKVEYEIEEMPNSMISKRTKRDEFINSLVKKLTTNRWLDYLGNSFDNKYRILSNIVTKYGEEGLDDILSKLYNQSFGKAITMFRPILKTRKNNVENNTNNRSE